MTHKIIDFYTDVQSKFTSTDSYIYITNTNTSVDLTGLTYDNGYIVLNVKDDNFDSRMSLGLYLRNYIYPGSGEMYFTLSLNSSHNQVLNGESWTCLRIPLDNFSYNVTVGSWSPAEIIQVAIGTLWSDVGSATLKIKDMSFEFGDDLQDHDQISLVASGGGNAISFQPEFDYKYGYGKIESRQRLYNGDEYSYKFGDYPRVSFSQKYFPNSAASTVNSLWSNNTYCRFIHTNSFYGTLDYMKVGGNASPFVKFQRPYTTLKEGMVYLEGYE